jgi:hypothetical protein
VLFVTVVLNGIQDVGMENGEVYFSGHIDTDSSEYEFSEIKGNLCNFAVEENLYGETNNGYGRYLQNDDNVQCELQDGTYSFSTEIKVPAFDNIWYDTGWTATGQIYMYSSEMVHIGYCEASIRTLSPIGPSSKTLFLVVVPLTVAVFIIVITYFGLRRAIQKNRNLCDGDPMDKSTEKGASDSLFRQPSRQKSRGIDDDADALFRRPSGQKSRGIDDDATAYQRMEEANTKSAIIAASSAANESTDYHRMSEDNVELFGIKDKEVVAPGKNENAENFTLNNDLTAVEEDPAAMGGDMMSTLAGALSNLASNQETNDENNNTESPVEGSFPSVDTMSLVPSDSTTSLFC